MLWLLAIPLLLIVLAGLAVVGYYWYISRQLDSMMDELQQGLSRVRQELGEEYRLLDDLTDIAEGYMQHQRDELDRLGELSPDVGDTFSDLAESRERVLELEIGFLESVQDYPELRDDTEFQSTLDRIAEKRYQRHEAIQQYNDLAEEYNDLVEDFPSRLVAEREGYSWVERFRTAA